MEVLNLVQDVYNLYELGESIDFDTIVNLSSNNLINEYGSISRGNVYHLSAEYNNDKTQRRLCIYDNNNIFQIDTRIYESMEVVNINQLPRGIFIHHLIVNNYNLDYELLLKFIYLSDKVFGINKIEFNISPAQNYHGLNKILSLFNMTLLSWFDNSMISMMMNNANDRDYIEKIIGKISSQLSDDNRCIFIYKLHEYSSVINKKNK